MARWYLKNMHGHFAVVTRAKDLQSATVTWTRNPNEATLLDRDVLVHALWFLTNGAQLVQPANDVLTLERAS